MNALSINTHIYIETHITLVYLVINFWNSTTAHKITINSCLCSLELYTNLFLSYTHIYTHNSTWYRWVLVGRVAFYCYICCILFLFWHPRVKRSNSELNLSHIHFDTFNRHVNNAFLIMVWYKISFYHEAQKLGFLIL